ncbi:MAG: SsrA-binding protein SmpB [Paludibacteraceae bacterium]|nr:SsrA-binding protein SmpB [Paludibacteraceae bacterium]MBP6284756.1 SsrA-binding protein SmpB [Paludibacteraceae bacterium]
MNTKQSTIRIKNKRASFDYELSDRYVAGIVLVGTEIKALRDGKANLTDSFCFFVNGELWVKNLSISSYFYGSYNNHDPRRDRKLLLQSKELRKLERNTKDKGCTIVPTVLFINERGLAKLEIAIAKGKKEYDKRETLKLKEDTRIMDRVLKSKG